MFLSDRMIEWKVGGKERPRRKSLVKVGVQHMVRNKGCRDRMYVDMSFEWGYGNEKIGRKETKTCKRRKWKSKIGT